MKPVLRCGRPPCAIPRPPPCRFPPRTMRRRSRPMGPPKPRWRRSWMRPTERWSGVDWRVEIGWFVRPRPAAMRRATMRRATIRLPAIRLPGARGLAVAGRFVRNTVDRAFLGADRGPGERLDHFACGFGIGDPLRVELVWARRIALVAVAGVDLAGVAAVQQLEQMVLRLAGAAEIADQRLRQRGILDAVFFFAALAQGAAVETDDRGMTEIRVDPVETGGIGDRDIGVVGPRHRLGHQD